MRFVPQHILRGLEALRGDDPQAFTAFRDRLRAWLDGQQAGQADKAAVVGLVACATGGRVSLSTSRPLWRFPASMFFVPCRGGG